jgi:hypothetical protein
VAAWRTGVGTRSGHSNRGVSRRVNVKESGEEDILFG